MATLTDAWITRKSLILYRGATPPNPNKFFLCYSASTTLGRADSLDTYINAELTPTNGYQRRPVIWTTDGAFSNANKRHELPLVTTSFTAAGVIQISTAFLLADAHSKAGEVWASANVSGNTITIAGHLLANGDRIIPVADPGSTLPSGLTSGTAYTAINVSGDTFQFSSNGSTAISLGNTGSGAFQLRYASGTPVWFETEDTPIVLQSGQPLEYDINMVEFNAAFGNGV